MEALVTDRFWKGRRVFVTGHTGFKGSWLLVMLDALGAKVAGYSLDPPTNPSLFGQIRGDQLCRDVRGDIRDTGLITQAISDFDPEVLIHLAAQPIVLAASKNGLETVGVNTLGTACVLEAARSAPSLKAVLSVTTDKVYENREWNWGYRESDALGGHEPYGASKACAELVTSAWARSFLEPRGTCVATARAGNVIGGGDWAQARLVPDAIRAWRASEPLMLRAPSSVRPWQHVLEPLSGYLLFCQRLAADGAGGIRALNFGPRPEDARTVTEVCDILNGFLPRRIEILRAAADSVPVRESQTLQLDSGLASATIGWRPRLRLENALRLTAQWYSGIAEGENARDLCRRQYEEFSAIAE